MSIENDSAASPGASAPHDRVDLACSNCGYSLRGLPIDGACPECGFPIADTLAARGGFTRHQLALLVCRGLALWVLVHIGLHLAQSAQGMLWMMDLQARGMTSAITILGALIPSIVNLGIAATLWFGGPWIAKRIFTHDGLVRIGGQARVWDWLPLAPLSVGVVFVAIGVRAGLYLVGALFFQVASEFRTMDALQTASYFVVGATLLFGGPCIVQGIKWLQTAGQTTGAP